MAGMMLPSTYLFIWQTSNGCAASAAWGCPYGISPSPVRSSQRTIAGIVGQTGVVISSGYPPCVHWLLVRRHPSKPDKLAYYVVFGPADTSLATLARVAGRRWAIEECFEVAKQEVGLADYEIRSRHGWYRHITLAMLALAFLAAMRVRLKAAAAPVTTSDKKGQPEPDLWSISAQMKSAISSAACNSSPA